MEETNNITYHIVFKEKPTLEQLSKYGFEYDRNNYGWWHVYNNIGKPLMSICVGGHRTKRYGYQYHISLEHASQNKITVKALAIISKMTEDGLIKVIETSPISSRENRIKKLEEELKILKGGNTDGN